MFTPVNVKKLTNVSVVTLKKFGKRYELAIYPNKLYEYQKGITTNLEEIVQHPTIFRNVSKGEVCSKGDLDLFRMPKEDIIREILEKGHEQKNEATRDKEASMAEREIVDIVRWKVMKNGRFLSSEAIRDAILRVHNVQPGRVKKQAQEVVRKLEALGFERISFEIEVDHSLVQEYEGIIFKEEKAFVNSSDLPSFRKYCQERNIHYVVHRNEEEDDEEEII